MIYVGTSGYFYKNWIGDFYPYDIPQYRYFEYVRFYGYSGKYKGSYPNEVLMDIINKIIGTEAFVYFNNTDDNSAFRDALRFKKLIEEKN